MTITAEVLREQIQRIASLEPGWDTYDAPTPAPASVRDALAFCAHIEIGLVPEPNRVAPTADGHIVLSWLTEDRRANVEFFGLGCVATCVATETSGPTVMRWVLPRDLGAVLNYLDPSEDEYEQDSDEDLELRPPGSMERTLALIARARKRCRGRPPMDEIDLGDD